MPQRSARATHDMRRVAVLIAMPHVRLAVLVPADDTGTLPTVCTQSATDTDSFSILQVIRSETECDWRIVQFQRAMQRRGCPTIVYSKDLDFVNHMCPCVASLQRCGNAARDVSEA